MKFQFFYSSLILVLFSSCVSIPKETVELSATLGNDLVVLHDSHRNSVTLLFSRMKGDVSSFVDDVYAPFVIHYVLQQEMQAHKQGDTSLYSTIELAGKEGGMENTDAAIKVMDNFLNSARSQIEKKRRELLGPILEQEASTIAEVDQSYQNVIYANTSITNYLRSIRRVKDAQQEALSGIGLEGLDSKITGSLVELSGKVSAAVEKGREIDVKSDDALIKLESVFSEIKKVTK
jgi:hypothetical protein